MPLLVVGGLGVTLPSFRRPLNFRHFAHPPRLVYVHEEVCGTVVGISECHCASGLLMYFSLSEYSAHVTANGGLYYSHLQRKFWNVGFLSSFTPKQLPNIMLV